MEPAQIITIVLAVYAAALSTYLGIRELKRQRPRIEVSAKHGYVIDGEEYSEPVIIMQATNVGSGPVYLSGTGFVKEDAGRSVIAEPYPKGVLPGKLHERRNLITVYACRWFRDLIEHWDVMGAYFQDETGGKWDVQIDDEEKRFWLESRGDGWKLEERSPRHPVIKTTKNPPP